MRRPGTGRWNVPSPCETARAPDSGIETRAPARGSMESASRTTPSISSACSTCADEPMAPTAIADTAVMRPARRLITMDSLLRDAPATAPAGEARTSRGNASADNVCFGRLAIRLPRAMVGASGTTCPGAGQTRGGARGPLPPGGIGRRCQAFAAGVSGLVSTASDSSIGIRGGNPSDTVRDNWHSKWLCPGSQCSLCSASMCATVLDASASSTASTAGRTANATA